MERRTFLDPAVPAGKPVVRGTYRPVEFVADLLSQGRTEADPMRSYPGLTREDIAARLGYSSSALKAEKAYHYSRRCRKPCDCLRTRMALLKPCGSFVTRDIPLLGLVNRPLARSDNAILDWSGSQDSACSALSDPQEEVYDLVSGPSAGRVRGLVLGNLGDATDTTSSSCRSRRGPSTPQQTTRPRSSVAAHFVGPPLLNL